MDENEDENEDEDEDEKIILLGTSGGIPIPNRAQSGILVKTSEINILLDCGMAVPLRLAEAGFKAEDIDIVCLTHEHLDHVQDLPSLTKASWLRSREAKFKIISPPRFPDTLKNFWKSVDEYERSKLDFKVLNPGEKIEERVSIEAFNTDHTTMSQGYKIGMDGKEMVYTGDTAPIPEVKKISEDVDLLIHEMSYLKKTEGHTHPDGFISTYSDLDADRCVLTHFYPDICERIEEKSTEIEREIDVPIYPATDLYTFSL